MIREYFRTRSLKDYVLDVVAVLFAFVVSSFSHPQDGVMVAGNTLLNIAMITREALRVLENNLTFTKQVNRQFDDKFGVDGAKIGTVVNVRRPPRYVTRTGQALNLQDATETQVPVTLDTQAGVDLAFTSQDLALSIDDFSERFINPAVAAVANRIDQAGLALYKSIYQTVGTAGTTPIALLTYLLAGVKLNDSAAPLDGQRSLIVTPLMEATIVDALKGLFHQSAAIAEQYTKGQMGRAAGFTWYMDQNVASHTWGLQGGVPLVNGVPAEGATTLVTDAWTGAVATRVNAGDVFTLTGVFGVNPQSRQSTGALQQFVALADADSDGAGNLTINVSPALVSSGAGQTITAQPADNAPLTFLGTTLQVSPQGIAMHKDAFTLVTADLPLPRGVDMAARVSDKQLGISIRMVRAYDINLDRFPCRLDILFGWSVLRPELACRVQA